VADSKSLAVVVVGGIFAVLTSSIWGPPICRAVNVCEDTPASQTTTTTQPPPPTFTFVPPTETNVFLSLTSGPTGTPFKVSGEGFLPGETVIISMHTTEIGRTTASGAGSFSGVEVTVPEEYGVFAPQQFDVIARGQSSIKSARAPFTVSG